MLNHAYCARFDEQLSRAQSRVSPPQQKTSL